MTLLPRYLAFCCILPTNYKRLLEISFPAVSVVSHWHRIAAQAISHQPSNGKSTINCIKSTIKTLR
jgi:hypothetical protein